MELVTDNSLSILLSSYVVFLIIFVFGGYYKLTLKFAKSYADLPFFVFLVFSLIQWVNKTTHQILNKNYKFAVPFFLYIIFYFWLSTFISIFGFTTLGSSIEIPVIVSLVVFIGTIASGIINKKWNYINDYVIWIKFKKKKIFPIPDPLKFIGELSKVISLACRLWGNCLAGSVVIFILHYSINNFLINFQWLSPLVISGIVFPFHIYFDIIGGTIQSLIFMLLTMSYWMIASQTNNKH